MRVPLLTVICLLGACVPQDSQNNPVITVGDDAQVTTSLDASVPAAPMTSQDSGHDVIIDGPVDSGSQLGTTLDAGDVTPPNVETVDAGTPVGCASAFFDALEPHLPNLATLSSESDSYWYEFQELSTNSGTITLDELRSVFIHVGPDTEGVFEEEDWDDDLAFVIEQFIDSQAAQATLDAVEDIFSQHLTDITYVHFGAMMDVEHYFLRVGRSACGEILGLWALVIWT